ncbi:uncharacterized protein BJX67DRAFT_209733 [Aspergillus lucknowensis]|uniref:Uncharacterized protein n=1 Tax=Aspergillus lucknowensis TaxID=176173 RepID=A0ABR4M318_9EURO
MSLYTTLIATQMVVRSHPCPVLSTVFGCKIPPGVALPLFLLHIHMATLKWPSSFARFTTVPVLVHAK